jgi:multiple sugar transport system permease protein/sn-glycerol 3-phosphate transport system permease protein
MVMEPSISLRELVTRRAQPCPGGGKMTAAAAPTLVPKRARAADSADAAERRHVRTAFTFLAPSLIGVVLFLVIPVIFVIILSLTQWNLLTPIRWVGLSNYANIFRFDGFGHSLLVTAYYVLLNIPFQTVLALGLAMLLNNKLPGSALIRVICVLPFLATPVAMGIVWNWFFSPTTGIINELLSHIGITGPAWLSNSATAMPVIAFANIWQYVGYNMLFFLAGLQAVPAALYEAASLDGASKVQQFRRVTLPLLRPALLFVLVTSVIGSFQVFDTVYVMTNGGPGNATSVANLNIYNTAFAGFRIGEASAMSVVLFVLILIITVAQFRYFNRRTTYEIA